MYTSVHPNPGSACMTRRLFVTLIPFYISILLEELEDFEIIGKAGKILRLMKGYSGCFERQQSIIHRSKEFVDVNGHDGRIGL